MKKPKITEGKWSSNYGEIQDKNGSVICSFIGADIPISESLSNEKAISAVPEMIDALIFINESHACREVMGSIARSKMINALKKAGVEL